jgi:DNA repair exonuclease SbcCD ATPase subunit
MNIRTIRKKVDALRADRSQAIKQHKEEKSNLKEAQSGLDDMVKAQVIAQEVAQVVQKQAHDRIEGVVCKCLEAVFGTLYGFRIDFQRKRGRTEANLLLLKDGHEIQDPLNADSGGVIDVAALALRLACIVLAKPTLKRIIIMDEPFRNLDMENRERIRILLEELSEDFKVQFIIVTHEDAFKTGKVIKI